MPRRALAGVPDWVPGLELDSADLRKLLNMQVKATQRHHSKKKKKTRNHMRGEGDRGTAAASQVRLPSDPTAPEDNASQVQNQNGRTGSQSRSSYGRFVDGVLGVITLEPFCYCGTERMSKYILLGTRFSPGPVRCLK